MRVSRKKVEFHHYLDQYYMTVRYEFDFNTRHVELSVYIIYYDI